METLTTPNDVQEHETDERLELPEKIAEKVAALRAQSLALNMHLQHMLEGYLYGQGQEPQDGWTLHESGRYLIKK